MSLKQWCKHYSGMHGKTHCDAGVLYSIFKGKKHEEIPCWEQLENPCCDKAEYQNAEEIDAEVKAFTERIEKLGTARQAIVAHLGPWKRGVGKSGKILCPVCTTGTLVFSRAGINGHIHAGCSTDGCVRWME